MIVPFRKSIHYLIYSISIVSQFENVFQIQNLNNKDNSIISNTFSCPLKNIVNTFIFYYSNVVVKVKGAHPIFINIYLQLNSRLYFVDANLSKEYFY